MLRACGGYSHPHTTALSAKHKACTHVSPITVPHYQTLAAFSTHTNGLREILMTNFKLGNPIQYK
jgi:hypothetical protein